MVEAAASGCIDYSLADSQDHKFTLKELWICDHLRSKRIQTFAEEQLATKRHLILASGESAESYFSFMELYKKLILPWEESGGATNDVDRYTEVFGEVSSEDTNKLNEHLEKKTRQASQQKDAYDALLAEADKLVANKFKHRIN